MKKLQPTRFPAGQRALLRRVKRTIVKEVPDATVILYGSRARGDAREDSDWDIMVLTDRLVTMSDEMKVWDRIYDISLETGTLITAFVRERSQWETPLYRAMPYHRNIEREGIIV